MLCAAFLAGCGTPTRQNSFMGGNTEYLAEPPAHQTHRRTVDDNEESARTVAARRVSTKTVSANPSPSPRPKRKVEAEVRDPSELQIDDETRQRMDANGAKTAAGNKKMKPKKVEAEVHDASDLQIDEQTKKAMDKPQ